MYVCARVYGCVSVVAEGTVVGSTGASVCVCACVSVYVCVCAFVL